MSCRGNSDCRVSRYDTGEGSRGPERPYYLCRDSRYPPWRSVPGDQWSNVKDMSPLPCVGSLGFHWWSEVPETETSVLLLSSVGAPPIFLPGSPPEEGWGWG